MGLEFFIIERKPMPGPIRGHGLKGIFSLTHPGVLDYI